MNKITKKLLGGVFTKLLRKAQEEFGFPNYYEEMVLYLYGGDTEFRISIRSGRDMVVSRKNEDGEVFSELRLESGELKNALLSLKNLVSDSGHISISPVFEFVKNKTRIYLIKNSLAGPIITVLGSPEDQQEILGLLQPFIAKKGKEKQNLDTEKIIDFQSSARGLLNEKIISYIERNGIYLNRNKKTTLRDVLESKSNDYSEYSGVFEMATSHALISKSPLPTSYRANTNRITISVIIPCYNTENTISRVLESIEYQYKNNRLEVGELEVILVDDGSQKPIALFIKKNNYGFQLQVIRLEKNLGLSSARHIGVTASKGDIIIFMDSDILLEKNYLTEHLVRNLIIPNAVFVSFKENVETNDPRITEKQIKKGLQLPNYSNDLRIYKNIKKDAVGNYSVTRENVVEILESTKYFKSFSGSRVFGVYDLSCMVIGHNFSTRRETVLRSSPFTNKINGWGMEDVYFGLKLINDGNFIIPVLSTGVYHINHEPRSGSEEKKREEYKKNTEIIQGFLGTEVKEGFESIDPLETITKKKGPESIS